MEFFRVLKDSKLNNSQLKNLLTINSLPWLCESIDSVISDNGDNGVIYCIWGQFEVNLEALEFGVRFSLPNCPNALAWTITSDENSTDTVIHCSINKQEHDEYFIETINQFVDDWKKGLSDAHQKVPI